MVHLSDINVEQDTLQHDLSKEKGKGILLSTYSVPDNETFPGPAYAHPILTPNSVSNFFDECFAKMTVVFFIFNVNLNVNHCHVSHSNVFRDSWGVPEDSLL